mmetsp:Transcript_23026/g.36862  ORF Transcript_23026/g.36862 Transcript_23026/m.36862 type:complete len:81 (-) Transcript_23026:169-411(-)
MLLAPLRICIIPLAAKQQSIASVSAAQRKAIAICLDFGLRQQCCLSCATTGMIRGAGGKGEKGRKAKTSLKLTTDPALDI